MWKIAAILFFIALICVRCQVAFKAFFPDFKGYAAVSVSRMVIFATIGIASLWTSGMTSQVILILGMVLWAASYFIPVKRPKMSAYS